MKYFIHLAYKGTHYHGWQRQPAHITVQEVLEDAMQRMTGERIHCIGCSRTDAGVHASQFFCHIKVDQTFDFDPVFRLNKMLPDDISIYDFIRVHRNAHAQHDVTSRTYTYRIHTHKNAFLSETSALYPHANLNTDAITPALSLLTHYQDYRSMCRQPNAYDDTSCEITNASMEVGKDGRGITFTITANRFLKGMVRILIANLLEIGYGRLEVDAFEDCLRSQRRTPHFHAAYPQGLYLSSIEYPYLEAFQ